MNLVDSKYVGILSARLDRFATMSHMPMKANFRCPICGDSQKSKTKKRGWLLEKDNAVFFHCFNCGESANLANFMKRIDFGLFENYIIDRKMGEIETENQEVYRFEDTKPEPKPEKKYSMSGFKKVSQLSPEHPAKRYIESRGIPPSQHYRMYWVDKFNKWVNSLIPNKLSEKGDCGRIVIPFFDEKGDLFGFAGRKLNGTDDDRYITIMLKDRQKVFGLEKIDFTRPYYIVEGQFDSMFIENSLAMAGADLDVSKLKNPENATVILDNEPRNAQIVKRLKELIDEGRQVVIWRNGLKGKDINEMVLAGVNIKKEIETKQFKGLEAAFELSNWRKVENVSSNRRRR